MQQHFTYGDKGRFRILQLTDLHYEDGGKRDLITLQLMRDLINWEKPDLIFITGDFNTNKDSLDLMAQALDPIIDSGLPYCYVFGNHDAEYGAPRKDLARVLSKLPGCVNPKTAPGIPGYSNFALTLGDQPAKPDWLLIGLDSNMYNANPLVGGYDYVRPKQIEWYAKTVSQRKTEGEDFGVLAFQHIPLPEYIEAFKKGKYIGQHLEDVCCPNQNSGLFSAMLEGGHTRGVFVGHDHLNDVCSGLYGVILCYGRAGGYSTYGRRGYLKGGRVIELKRGDTRNFVSWLRLSDGSVKDQFNSGNLLTPGGQAL